jgi:hypothetical protein
MSLSSSIAAQAHTDLNHELCESMCRREMAHPLPHPAPQSHDVEVPTRPHLDSTLPVLSIGPVRYSTIIKSRLKRESSAAPVAVTRTLSMMRAPSRSGAPMKTGGSTVITMPARKV